MSKRQIITGILGCKEKEHKMNDTEIINSLMRIDGRSQSINMIASNRIQDLNIEIARITAERDEARRMYCGRVSRDVQPDAFDIAKNHGWDCFPQEDDK
jgi:hypothetical protein